MSAWIGEMHAEKDLKGFLIASALAMNTGYHTSNDVLKQVSHRGAIRMPAYMAKGKCRRGLLAQFAVQRETRAVKMDDGSGRFKTRGSIGFYGMEEMSHIMTT